jgi:hypothetical protein
MTSFLVQLVNRDGLTVRYLRYRPFDQVWGWFSGDIRHATPMSEELADRLAGLLRLGVDSEHVEPSQRPGDRVEIVADPRERPAFNDVRLLQEQLVNGR